MNKISLDLVYVARLLYSLNTSNILCSGFLLRYLKLERKERHERKRFPFSACLRACYTLEIPIYAWFSPQLKTSSRLGHVCAPATRLFGYIKHPVRWFSPQILISRNQQDKATIKIKFPGIYVCACSASWYLLYPAWRSSSRLQIQCSKDWILKMNWRSAHVCLLSLKVKCYAHQTKIGPQRLDVCAWWALWYILYPAWWSSPLL